MDSRTFISDEQKELLKEAKRTKDQNKKEIIFLYLAEKHAHENIHVDWLLLWEETSAKLSKFFPNAARQRIESVLKYTLDVGAGISRIDLGPDDKVCLIIGAGTSAPPPSCIPITKDLLKYIHNDAEQDPGTGLDKLMQFCLEKKIEDIEALFTAVYFSAFAGNNRYIVDLLQYLLFRHEHAGPIPISRTPLDSPQLLKSLERELNLLFVSLARLMIPATPNRAHTELARHLKKYPHTRIVTTNYDCILEEALTAANVKFTTHMPRSWDHMDSLSYSMDPNCVELLKIHGSINWSYCSNCHAAIEKEFGVLKTDYQRRRQTYTLLGLCPECEKPRLIQPLLIPPLGVKSILFPNLIKLWHGAQQAIEEASLLIVTGYSFPQADQYIRKVVEHSMASNRKQKTVVCDRNPEVFKDLSSRLKRASPESDIENRMFYAHGSAEMVLPAVLDRIFNRPV